ncbi:MAG: hypothetical protein QW063_01640 [Candidatus Nanoarchaeia archaeon]
MSLPRYIPKTDLETYFKELPLDRFNDIIEGRIYVPKIFRAYVNEVLNRIYGISLPTQMRIDAYAELWLPYIPLPNFATATQPTGVAAEA